MLLQFDERMLKSLRQRRDEQLAGVHAGRLPAVEDLLVADEVIWVRSGFGNASFLGLDGRAIFWNYGDGYGPEVLTDLQGVACVVAWAAEGGLSELLEVLPKMPSNAKTCRQCNGSRWMRKKKRTVQDQSGGPQVCHLCHGLGWTVTEQSVGHGAADDADSTG